MDVVFFDKKVKRFVNDLEMSTAAKVFRMFELLEKFGHALGMPHSKHIRNGLFELRARGTQEVRIFYAFYKDAAMLLHGFFKKSQRTPTKELKIALQKLSTIDKI